MGALLEVDMYTVGEVLEVVLVRMIPVIQNTEIVVVTPTWAQMGHEDLMVALVPDISNAIVVLVNKKDTEVFQKNYFVL